jgi:LAO/AO transport system kinase
MSNSAYLANGREPDHVEVMANGIVSGDVHALAQAITMVEQHAPERILLLKALFPFTGKARILGVTGAAGSGKSTLVSQLIRLYRQHGNRVAVLAVDPTSPFSGGATLGDRIRMQGSAADPGVFIRSMASRGQTGGLAPTTGDAGTLLDAGGWDRIIVETVGVGQDQLEILTIADATVAVMPPGMGDDIQIAKAGLIEAADIFVINKADLDGTDRIELLLHEGLSIGARRADWTPPIVRTIATTGQGISDLHSAIDDYFQYLRGDDRLLRKRIEKCKFRLLEMVRQHFIDRLTNPQFELLFSAYAQSVAERELDPYTAIEHLLGTRSRAPVEAHAKSWRVM